jgi:alpha,alpha-trehalose-phosphate synthase [UDP-forming]/trehalose-phosphatase
MKLAPAHSAEDELCLDLARHRELTLLLDVDGTLIPFAPTPEAAILDPAAVEVLERLRDGGVRLVIVSGRAVGMIEPLRAAIDGLYWFAEHGSWNFDERGEWHGPPTAPEIDGIGRVLEPFSRAPGARLEIKSLSACLHWRMVPRAIKAELIAGAELACDEWLESHPDFEQLDGDEMLEVRRRTANKGRAVAWVRERAPGARIIALGDDHTDEDMFAALHDADLAISVGTGRTRARCKLSGPMAVRAFLSWLAGARSGETCRPFPSLERLRLSTSPSTSLLIASNRIPPAGTARQRPVGGLVSALEPALLAQRGVWLGWSGAESEGERRLMLDDESAPARASFDFPPRWRTHFYGGFCNRALWPLFHGFPGRVSYEDDDWQAYVAANAEFARHAQTLVAAEGSVWIHDYHLLLAGRALRQRGFEGALGLFLHVPFPHRDLFDTLPWAAEIIAAMLDFDLIGFQTQQWAENFTACALERATEADLPRIEVFPVGVDPRALALDHEPADAEIAGLRASLGNRKMILGVDRLDYAKGIPERLLAFERLLEAAPEWCGRVSFVQISVPSRADVPEYAELRHRVENLVGRINGRFGEANWVPVRYLYRSYDLQVLTHLYRLADVALVTPLRDGLNLVAKEFVLAQDARDPGVLVLSRFAGAAVELRDALLTNPYHAEGLAGDIDRALRMDADERLRRHALLTAALAGETPQRWAATFLARLRHSRDAAVIEAAG